MKIIIISNEKTKDFSLVHSFKAEIPINCIYISFDTIWIGTHKEIHIYAIDYKVSFFFSFFVFLV